MQEDMHDELGCNDNVEGAVHLDRMDMVAVENNEKISAITSEMAEKFTLQRLRDSICMILLSILN